MGFSKPHWEFQGLCISILYLVPARQAASLIPPPLSVSEVVAGFTLGGIYAARFGRGRSGTVTSEFGVLPAYVSYGGKKGFFMHNYCVDCDEAGQHGRRIWGADKVLSDFSWEVTEKYISLDVSSGGEQLINLKMRPLINKIPVTAGFPILCVKGNSVVFVKNHYASNIGISSSTVSIPKESPLSKLPFKVKLISTFWDASNIIVKEPEYIHEKVLRQPDKALGSPIGRQT